MSYNTTLAGNILYCYEVEGGGMESITRVLSFLFGIIRKSSKGHLTKSLIYTFHWLRSRCRLKLRHSLYYGLAANDFINEHVL